MKPCIFLLVFIVIFICTIPLSAVNRLEHHRLLQNNAYSNIDINAQESRWDNTYHYRNDYPELIDSIGYFAYTTQNGDTLEAVRKTYFFDSVILFSDNLKYIYYWTTDSDDPSPYRYSYTVQDYLGRTVRNGIELWNASQSNYLPNKELYRHYNNLGYCDSLYFASYEIPVSPLKYYCKRVFDDNILLSGILYWSRNNQWIPQARYSYTYPESQIEFPSPIRFDNFISQTFNPDFFFTEIIYNPDFLTDTITYETWNGTSWDINNDATYGVNYHNGAIGLLHSEPSSGGSGIITFPLMLPVTWSVTILPIMRVIIAMGMIISGISLFLLRKILSLYQLNSLR